MGYKKILIAINIYEDYEHIVRSAEILAGKYAAEVDIVTVIDNAAEFVPAAMDFQKALLENAKEKLDEIKAHFTTLKANYHILEGAPAGEIIRFSRENHNDLIMIGSHARHGLNLLLGSTANSVLHKSACDVLTVRVHERGAAKVASYEHILVATDLEDDSVEVAELAKEVAVKFNSEVSTITVIGDPTIVTGIYGIVPEVQTKLDEASKEKLSQWAKKYQFTGNQYNLSGAAADEITSAANEFDYGLIIIGSHQRGAIGRFFLGSTANAVLHHAKQDVLVKKLKG
ncbi:MAG: universal stress protein [Francisellaceae bacterium]